VRLPRAGSWSLHACRARVPNARSGNLVRIAGNEQLVQRGRRTIRLTRLGQVWWPERGITKADVVEYYGRIAPFVVPHLRDRPFTMKRHYNGPRSPFEWVKDAPPELPPWIPVSPQPARSRGGELVRYPLLNDDLALLWMVDFGCVDLHVWTSRRDRPDRPDVVLFDLDPAGVPFGEVARAALLLREALALFGLESWPMTTGGDGMHVRVPIARRHGYDEVRLFADVVSRALVRSSGGLVTVERSRARRRGVFVDTKMNGHGQQIVAPYSLRPVPSAAVAAPLRWDEVDETLDPGAFGIEEVVARTARGGDLGAPLLRGRQLLSRALASLG
jgi:bifunctional non-homologous end joining protein LigD